MDRFVAMLGAMTSIMVGVGAFVLILLFASAYLHVVEWVFGAADDRRFVFAGGLVLGFAVALRGLDCLIRWYDRSA